MCVKSERHPPTLAVPRLSPRRRLVAELRTELEVKRRGLVGQMIGLADGHRRHRALRCEADELDRAAELGAAMREAEEQV